MPGNLNFYEVNKNYINYLSQFNDKVPKINYSLTGGHDKFLCGVIFTINNYNYFAPVSSYNIKQRSNFIIKNEKGEPISSLRFSFMIPVPLEEVRELPHKMKQTTSKHDRIHT